MRSTEELCEMHSNWMMSMRLLLCTPRKPASVSRPSNDSMHSRNSLRFLFGGGLMPEEVHAQGVGAGAELFVHLRSQRHRAQVRILAADNRQNLQAIHLRHLQVANQQLKRLGFQHGYDARPGCGGVNLGPAGQLRQDFPVQVQQVRIVIRQQDFRASVHCFLRQPLTSYKCQYKHEKPMWFPLSGSKDYSPQAAFMNFLMEGRARLVVKPLWPLPALACRARDFAETGSNRTKSPVMGQPCSVCRGELPSPTAGCCRQGSCQALRPASGCWHSSCAKGPPEAVQPEQTK